MKLTDFVPENHIILDLRASSKKGVFEALASAVASETDIDAKHVLDLLLERERLGTTGIGEGVAIPHAKIKDLPELVGFFIRTSSPIDFDALDEKNVDLVFVLLAPEGASAEHLKALAKIARVFRDTERRDELRKAKSPQEVITLLNEQPARNAA
jgi:PTS system nitrogen regulatory IIA component